MLPVYVAVRRSGGLRVAVFPLFRRKLKADVSAAFPSLTADELCELIPNKEELNVVKIYAHKGDAVTLYVLHKNPLFFELEKRLYPTGDDSTAAIPLRWHHRTGSSSHALLLTAHCHFPLFSLRALAPPCSPADVQDVASGA